MLVYIVFLLFVFSLLALDLGVFHKSQKEVSMKESLAWTAVWVSLALLFGGVVYWMYDTNFLNVNPINPETHSITAPGKAMIDFYTGYLIEESLSLDNIFVMALIFAFFRIKPQYQHNILFWGILGAVVFRLIMIVLGTAFVAQFHWAMYVFGVILLYSAFKMLKESDEESDFKKSFGVRLLSKVIPIDWEHQTGAYIVRKDYFAGLFGSNRIYGHRIRGRFHSGYFCRHQRSVHCLYLQYLCNSRLAKLVFFPLGNVAPFRIPQVFTGVCIGIHRSENAGHGLDRNRKLGFINRNRRGIDSGIVGFFIEDF